MSDKSDFHLVRPSPWPLFASAAAAGLLLAFVFFLHGANYSGLTAISFLFLLLACMFCWWRDIVSEAVNEEAHSNLVKKGLRVGMVIFILSEVIFFAAFFGSFFKAWLDPVSLTQDYWPIKALSWPPQGLELINPWNLPLLNTFILLLSGTTVTWAHYALLKNDNRGLVKATALTVMLGLIFTSIQLYEYHHAPFFFHEEGYKGIYSSNFFMATGFHGMHVLIGTIFLGVCLFRAIRGQFTPKDHLGFEFAAWYWHFVDVVWLFLFTFLYWLSAV